MERLFFKVGLLLIFVAFVVFALRKLGMQPGKLPGDIRISKEGFEFWFPLTTSLLISGLITGGIWLFRLFDRFFK
ncbi:hypothetical protein IX53_04920 [Kosmotoga pacifica]|uniref:DUF2905 domain-containing protein n=1 Tax=Kosmotoga pacifica TaxID=1330330 RepID=A0A0G2ZFE1_9BACT|nr:hypothetical protein IX53_04920 [Kosmotoga pacifica]